jgi:hypothetical protein
MCVLKLFSDTHSFKELATEAEIYSVYDKGEHYTKSKVSEEYRVSFDVSDHEWDKFHLQVKDAISFLEKNESMLKELLVSHNVNYSVLDFPLYSRLNNNIAAQFDNFPARLIKVAGSIGLSIEISYYHNEE